MRVLGILTNQRPVLLPLMQPHKVRFIRHQVLLNLRHRPLLVKLGQISLEVKLLLYHLLLLIIESAAPLTLAT